MDRATNWPALSTFFIMHINQFLSHAYECRYNVWRHLCRSNVIVQVLVHVVICIIYIMSCLCVSNILQEMSRNGNCKLEISTVPTKAKSREPAYSLVLFQNIIDIQTLLVYL